MLGWILASVLVLVLLILYSLVGWSTGVYRFSSIDYIGPGKGYLVADGNRWLVVFVWETGGGISGEEMTSDRVRVNPGIWVMDLHALRSDEREQVITAMDLIDVYALRFGRHREAVKKLSSVWTDPPGVP